MTNLINIIVQDKAEIIAAIIMALGMVAAALIQSKHNSSALPPNEIVTTMESAVNSRSLKKSIFQKRWFILVISLLCMSYVLPEALMPGELTRLAVYKIIMGVAVFFYVLIQASIANMLDAIYMMKTADLNLIKSILKTNP